MGLIYAWQIASVKQAIKQQIKEGVPKEDQVVIPIPKGLERETNNIFEWKEPREFRYKGEMYDVLYEENRGDTTWYTCIHDVKESGLFKELNAKTRLYLRVNQQEQKKRALAFHLCHLQYCFYHAGVFLFLFPEIENSSSVMKSRVLIGFVNGQWHPPNC